MGAAGADVQARPSTAAAYPQQCLQELIAEQAQRTPQAVAVECGGERLTYGELQLRSNQLANHLRALGVGPDVLVGIAVERSVEMLVGVLGILRAGGAYVPIDPAYPPDRQAYMLEDSQAPILLTQERLLEAQPAGAGVEQERPLGALPVGGGVEVLCLDRDWPEIARAGDAPPAVEGDPEQLAYVIYTSGSTGKPKGVQIPHRALVNFLSTMREQPGLDAADVLLAVTTLSFDIAGLELYLPLVIGARVVIARQRDHRPAGAGEPAGRRRRDRDAGDPDDLADAGRLRLAGARGAEGAVRRRGAAGRCSRQALVELGVELWNMYGPTETTIWSTCKRIEDRVSGRRSGGRSPTPRSTSSTSSCSRVPVGDAGRAVDRRRRPRARLPRPAGSDRGALRPGSRSTLTASGARADLPHRRPRPLPRRRRAGVPRPDRPPGQGPGLPHRARRDRDRARPPPGGQRGGGGRTRAGEHRGGAGGLRDRRAVCRWAPRSCGASSRRRCPSTWCPRP